MASQTTLDDTSRANDSSNLVGKAAGVAHDMLAIGELQARLLAIDLKTVARSAGIAAVLGAIALVLTLAAMPVLLLALGYWVAEVAEWSMALALAVVALAAIALAVTVAAAAWVKLHHQSHVMQRSATELKANVAAMKNMLSDYAGREQF